MIYQYIDIDIDKSNLKDIDIDKTIPENIDIDINIDIDKNILRNIYSDDEILLYRFVFLNFLFEAIFLGTSAFERKKIAILIFY